MDGGHWPAGRRAMKRISQSANNGVAFGAWLTERAARVLHAEYGNRPGSPRHLDNRQPSEAEKRVHAILEDLRTALHTRADEPAISAALTALDLAIWELAMEAEETAFYAAWTVAMNLRGGR